MAVEAPELGYVDQHPPDPEKLDDPVARRFWAKVEVAAAPPGRWFLGACWRWTGNKSGGYGRFKLDGKLVAAHRWSWRWANGDIPKGLTLDHLCHEAELCPDWRTCPHRQCVRPSHLGLVSNAVNATRNQSPPAQNGRKARCKHGHLLEGNNLVIQIRRSGKSKGRQRRQCRTCQYGHWRRWNRRLNEKERAREAAARGQYLGGGVQPGAV